MKTHLSYTTTENAQKHDNLMPLLSSMLQEFQELSRQQPQGVLNETKIQIVTRLLDDAFKVIAGEATISHLDPINKHGNLLYSDMALILSQVVAAMTLFKEKYHRYFFGSKKWATRELIEALYPHLITRKEEHADPTLLHSEA